MIKIVKIIGILSICWLVGFASFFYTSRHWNTKPYQMTDGIVVLTGGKGRIEKGLQLLGQGYAKKLLISGVHTDVRLPALIRKENEKMVDLIELDYQAHNTIGNARETKRWLNKNHLESLRLVTADYHLLRSLLEFRMHLPGIELYPYAVGLAPFSEMTSNHIKCWVKEFHKFMASLFRYLLFSLNLV